MSTPPRRRPRQARSRATVDVILEAAAQVLVQHGPQRATTARIAERAGVSVGSLYQYFANKKAIYTALGERYARGLRAAVAEAAPRVVDAPVLGILPALLDSVFVRITRDPVLVGMLHLTAVPPRDFEALAAFERELEQLAAVAIRQNPELSARSPDPDLSARFLVRAVTGAVARTLAQEPELVVTPAFRDEIMRLVGGYFGLD